MSRDTERTVAFATTGQLFWYLYNYGDLSLNFNIHFYLRCRPGKNIFWLCTDGSFCELLQNIHQLWRNVDLLRAVVGLIRIGRHDNSSETDKGRLAAAC